MSVTDFINTKLKLYSAQSNVRGIPFTGDGFKEAHRKAIWGMLSRGENSDFETVERISASAAVSTDYHHGIGSLQGTMSVLAQDFPNTNNLPLFLGKGQFGSRINAKPSAARYVKIKLAPIFRQIFSKADDLILEYNVSNGMKVEPKYLIPILPITLVNGAQGMGTGHATDICLYNPVEVRKMILDMLNGKEVVQHTLVPWWKGYTGEVARDDDTGQVTTTGKYEIKRGRTLTIKITELPVWTTGEAYTSFLKELIEKEKIIDFVDQTDKNGFDYTVQVARDFDLDDENIKKFFRLVGRTTENLTVWNGEGQLVRYDSIEDMLVEWVNWRLDRYEDRRLALIKKTADDIAWANLKVRFIRYYLANTKYFRDTPNKELIATLVSEGFTRHDELLAMPMRNLTHDKIKELEKDIEDLKVEKAAYEATDNATMFITELKALKL
jgi:DNA gyrase/topoisomerase IV subunit A